MLGLEEVAPTHSGNVIELWPPKDVHVLFPEHCDYITLQE